MSTRHVLLSAALLSIAVLLPGTPARADRWFDRQWQQLHRHFEAERDRLHHEIEGQRDSLRHRWQQQRECVRGRARVELDRHYHYQRRTLDRNFHHTLRELERQFREAKESLLDQRHTRRHTPAATPVWRHATPSTSFHSLFPYGHAYDSHGMIAPADDPTSIRPHARFWPEVETLPPLR